nr:hypothetical protein I308_05279 [Cryptococcus tetragattii IND107]
MVWRSWKCFTFLRDIRRHDEPILRSLGLRR